MRLDHMRWQDVERYLQSGDTILLPTGSTEQHGPIGLIGTDAFCAEDIATAIGAAAGVPVAPTLAYTPAPFNTAFPGTVSIPPDLFEALVAEILGGLVRQGFRHIYVVNGHGANLEPLHRAAAAVTGAHVQVRSWWGYPKVAERRRALYGDWEGMHATPSEVAVTQARRGIVHNGAEEPPEPLSPAYLAEHAGDRHGGPPIEHRAHFPDGRVGSHSALATPEDGQALFDTAVAKGIADLAAFTANSQI